MRVLSRNGVVASAFVGLLALGLRGPIAAADENPTVPPVTPTPTPANDAPPAVDAEKSKAIQKIVDELRVEVARIRGLEWKFPVPADVMTRDALRTEMIRQIKAELKPDVYERDLKLARRLGWLDADEDPIALTMKFLEKGIAGFYDPKTKHFYVIDGLQGDAQRPTIAHELLHALEDQHFDLQKQTDPIEEDSDRLFAMQCLEEGSAEFTRLAYQKAHPDITKVFLEAQRKDPSARESTLAAFTVPAFLVVPTILHYQTGPQFVTRAVGSGSYHDTMARMFADPPISQEQVLHPGRYLGKDRDLPRKIAWPEGLAAAYGEGWKGYKPSPVGELNFALWLDRYLGGSQGHLSPQIAANPKCCTTLADKASAGWDGATVQLIEPGESAGTSSSAVASILAWDSGADAWEAADALSKAIVTRYGRGITSAAWSGDEGGPRTFEYACPAGSGRIEVRADVVRWLEGGAAPQFARAWDLIVKAAVERDPADTWSKEKEPDPLAGATWKAKGGVAGWKAPGEG